MSLSWAIILVIALLLVVKAKGAVIPPETGGDRVEERLRELADAIAYAENGPCMTNFRNNPGNIKGRDGQIKTFSSWQEGYDYLLADLRYGFIEQKSSLYSPAMTFRELAWMWVCGGVPGSVCDPRDNPDAWASTVAGRLGVDVMSTVGEFLQS